MTVLNEAHIREYIQFNLAQSIKVSSQQIADHFSTNYKRFSKNSVISFCYRKAIQLPITPCNKNNQNMKNIGRGYFFPKEKIVKEKMAETSDGVSLLNVNNSQCRELIGHWRCCGKPVEKISYCTEHYRKNYVR